MKRLVIASALAALVAAGAGTAFAELTLEAAGWESGRIEKPTHPAVWRSAQSAALGGKGAPLLRGKAVLKNRGPKPAEGILLRYCVSARLLAAQPLSEAAWALPILVDERRVPKVGPNQVVEIPLSLSPKLEHYLVKLRRQGFRPSELKIQAMLELRGVDGVRVVESYLAVAP